MALVWKIDEVVNEIALWPVKKFYPTLIAKRTGLPIDTVFTRLLELTKDHKLCVKWELRCPGDNCARTLLVLDEKAVKLRDVFCQYCGHDFCEGDDGDVYDYIYPAFEVCKDYKEYLRQLDLQTKKKQPPMKGKKHLN
ncbi:hypothetical protein [Sporomusa sphaeroides]|uniref:Uncharacterized protein n=1 Tax=Sporomusa sphaeroides DSM 2875 TaxID=1337886 RepID=A0ABP2CCG5_9FIRM|nr:hypothetical protein [Sporomusa sphaeroides]OLS54965.1 hypothetical protein SPSPH_37020 [Sporomusa sphaeroides DSM 2875]CVK21915.1 hypothetical protein SSPH_04636 [Sporomusa sphaeroides DSM 2875]